MFNKSRYKHCSFCIVCTTIQTILEDYKSDNIYNADETGLFFRILPIKTFEFQSIQCNGGKMRKDRLTVMVCANMSGTDKLPLLVIGKPKNPRCFKNIKNIPVDYDANKTAWVTSDIFSTWVKKLDKRMTLQHTNLLNRRQLPRTPSYRRTQISQDGLPTPKHHLAHTTYGPRRYSQLQKQVIQRQLRAVDTETDIRISVLDAIHMMKNAWRLVTATTITKCYRHAGFVTDTVDVQTTDSDSDDPDDDIPLLGRLANGVTFDQFATADKHLPVCADLSDSDIVDNLLSQRPDTQCDDDDGDDVEPHQPPVNIIDVLNGLDRARDYIDQ